MMKLGHRIGATQQSAVLERWPVFDKNALRGYPRLHFVRVKGIRMNATNGSSSTDEIHAGLLTWTKTTGPKPQQTVAQQCQDAENYDSTSFS